MEKIVLEKLTEVARMLILAQKDVEDVQKICITQLKKEGRLPGLERNEQQDEHSME